MGSQGKLITNQREIEQMSKQATLLGMGTPFRPEYPTIYNKESYTITIFNDSIDGLTTAVEVIQDFSDYSKVQGTEKIQFLFTRFQRLGNALGSTSSHVERVALAFETAYTVREMARSLGAPFKIEIVDKSSTKSPKVAVVD